MDSDSIPSSHGSKKSSWRSKPTFILVTIAMGLFTDMLLHTVVVPILPFVLRTRLHFEEHEIPMAVSTMLAVSAGATAVFSVPTGWVIDHYGSRQIPFLAGLAMLLAATTSFSFGTSYWVLVVSRALQGFSGAIVWTAGMAQTQDTVGSDTLGQAIGTMNAVAAIAELSGPAIGGFLFDTLGIHAIFGVSASLLVINFIMRLLVVDKDHSTLDDDSYDSASMHDSARSFESEESAPTELDSLLPHKPDASFYIKDEQSALVQRFPILYCFKQARFSVALSLSFIGQMILGSFAATLPVEAESLLSFGPSQIGLLFFAINGPYAVCVPFAGRYTDRHGARIVATVGFSYMAIVLALLILPALSLLPRDQNIALLASILALVGVAQSTLYAGYAEAAQLVELYEKANPDFFGEHGAITQLHGFNTVAEFAGLSVGPVVSSALMGALGYAGMAAVLAGVAAATAVLAGCCLRKKTN